jgi:hypothetical protein
MVVRISSGVLAAMSTKIASEFGAQKTPGYCRPTPKCRNLCVQHAFFEGKKAEETFPRKSTHRTLKGVGQQYPFMCGVSAHRAHGRGRLHLVTFDFPLWPATRRMQGVILKLPVSAPEGGLYAFEGRACLHRRATWGYCVVQVENFFIRRRPDETLDVVKYVSCGDAVPWARSAFGDGRQR